MIQSAREKTAAVVDNVWFAYPGAPWVLQGVSFSVPQGARVALLGPSGAGKTTLLKMLAGFLQPQRGAVQVLGHRLQGRMPSDLRRKVGYVPQHLGLVRGLTALENTLLGTLGSCGGLGPLVGRFPADLVRQAEEYLSLLGLGDKVHERVMNLSGGQRQRVAIARTLMQAPRLILADEFVSDLDVVTAMQILEAMGRLSTERGFTLIMSLHDVHLVQSFADQAIVLKGGRVVAQEAAAAMQRERLRAMLA